MQQERKNLWMLVSVIECYWVLLSVVKCPISVGVFQIFSPFLAFVQNEKSGKTLSFAFFKFRCQTQGKFRFLQSKF